MAITAKMVKELREMTGAGMMDCKKALAATDGDMDKAVDFLREKGLAGAAKKAGRIAAEGIVATCLVNDDKKAVVVEVNAETDFVAKNEKFQNYVADVAAQAVKTSAKTMEEFLEEKWEKDPTLTVKEALSSQISIIGENMNIRRFEQIEEENGFVASYIHAGGKIGVLVDVETDVVNDAIKEMAKNVAMQAAALKPLYTSRDEHMWLLQYYLMRLIRDGEVPDWRGADVSAVSTDTLSFAAIIITSIPIVILYPLMSRYFTKGITVGAVKG